MPPKDEEDPELSSDETPQDAGTDEPGNGLAPLGIGSEQIYWTKSQLTALRALGHQDTPVEHLLSFFHICQATGLDPWRNEIYYIARQVTVKDSGTEREETRYTAQIGIDGFRRLARATGRMVRRVGPFWVGPEEENEHSWVLVDGIRRRIWQDAWTRKEPPAAAMCRIEHLSVTGEVTTTEAVARFGDFAPGRELRDEDPATGELVPSGRYLLSGMWARMPAHMIGKVAEALAYRAAFPRALSGLYEHAEMEQADRSNEDDPRHSTARRRESGRVVPGEVVNPEAGRPPVPAVERTAGDSLIEEGAAVGLAELSPERLRAEVAAYAGALKVPVEKFTRRWTQSLGKEVGQVTSAELADFLSAQRDILIAFLYTQHLVEEARVLEAGGLLSLLPDSDLEASDPPEQESRTAAEPEPAESPGPTGGPGDQPLTPASQDGPEDSEPGTSEHQPG